MVSIMAIALSVACLVLRTALERFISDGFRRLLMGVANQCDEKREHNDFYDQCLACEVEKLYELIALKKDFSR